MAGNRFPSGRNTGEKTTVLCPWTIYTAGNPAYLHPPGRYIFFHKTPAPVAVTLFPSDWGFTSGTKQSVKRRSITAVFPAVKASAALSAMIHFFIYSQKDFDYKWEIKLCFSTYADCFLWFDITLCKPWVYRRTLPAKPQTTSSRHHSEALRRGTSSFAPRKVMYQGTEDRVLRRKR